jgi:hypothetical protein
MENFKINLDLLYLTYFTNLLFSIYNLIEIKIYKIEIVLKFNFLNKYHIDDLKIILKNLFNDK